MDIKVTTITRANILATSFDVPSTSPVAHLKFFLHIIAIITPDSSPIVIPTSPVMLNKRNPSVEVIINDTNNFLLFMDSINGFPVPLGNGSEKVAHVTIPILAAISEIISI